MALPRLLLFDYGGVLLRLNDPLRAFGFGASRADFNQRWLLSDAVQAHERGQIDARNFAERMVQDMQLPYGPDEFLARFNAWPDRVLPATAALVRAIPAAIECAILSNTNALHWATQDIERDFGGRISRCFLSFEIGQVKPDSAVFRHVIEHVDVLPADILFIDDNPKNLDGARAEGMQACHCPDVDELESVLRDARIIG